MKGKVSVLEKMGLVKSIEMPQEEVVTSEENILFEAEDQFVQIDKENMCEVDLSQLLQIETIYEKTGLSGKEASIFKVAEIVESLPEELSTRQKRAVALKLLGTMHLCLEELLIDGQQRLTALMEAESKFNEETEMNVTSFKEEIKRMESRIDELKEKVIFSQKQNEAETVLLEEEIDKVNHLLVFIGEGSDV